MRAFKIQELTSCWIVNGMYMIRKDNGNTSYINRSIKVPNYILTLRDKLINEQGGEL
jgi:isoprenylcysteine carboxyl methyltransferase (ICMT) family protein YpbQ